MTLEPDTTIGRYRILGLLGRGGMADVYKAHQISLDRIVALKVIRSGFTDDPAFAERFGREARAIARLEHPNIVPVFDFEESDGRSLLVMQYLDSGTLKDRLIDAGGPLPARDAIRIVHGIADALDHAHASGIVHRDVKPSNVMLTAGGRVMVTDFGIAKMLGTATTQYTQTGVGVGTPDYMSPEQGQALAVDRRSDVYALGAVAYEMLTGRVPFSAETPIAVMLKHIRDPLPRPSELNPAIGPATEAVLAKAMAKAPDDRYSTAGEFAAALDASFSAPAPIVAPAGAPARRAAPTLPLIAAGLGLLALLGGGAALASNVFGRPTVAGPPAQPTVAAPAVTPSGGAPTATTPTATLVAAAGVTNCTPAVVTGVADVLCLFTGLPAGEPVSLTIQFEGSPPSKLPLPPGAGTVDPDGTWAFRTRTATQGPKGKFTVTLTAGGITKVMQYETQ